MGFRRAQWLPLVLVMSHPKIAVSSERQLRLIFWPATSFLPSYQILLPKTTGRFLMHDIQRAPAFAVLFWHDALIVQISIPEPMP